MMLADSNMSEWLGPALTGVIVAWMLGYLTRAAQAEAVAREGERRACYPKAMKWVVIGLWCAVVMIAATLGISVGLESWVAVLLIGGLGLLILPLHLETFGVEITWDDTMIYTRSPWRKARRIPMEAVRYVDYSSGMQWHRIHTAGYGIVRLHDFLGGGKELLERLAGHEQTPPNAQSAKGG